MCTFGGPKPVPPPVIFEDPKPKFHVEDTPKKAEEPKVEKVPGPPKDADKHIQSAKDEEARRARGRKGRKSTILTGPLGLQGVPNVKRKTLLGQ